mgnify:CR=1 FL=1
MKINEAIVLNKEFIEDKIKHYLSLIKYNEKMNTDKYIPKILLHHYQVLEANTKPLEPIVRDAMNEIVTSKNEIDQYINETDI